MHAREAAAAKFCDYMRRSNELHDTYVDEPGAAEQYDGFTEWQMEYLLTFFADLYERPGYEEAIDFTMTDLAGVSVSGRDRELERASPVVTTMLPRKALETIASAAELNARVLEVNLGIFRCLQEDGELPDEISERDYHLACRDASSLDECLGLVRLAIHLGGTLKTLIKVPLLGAMLRGMRVPAHAAGFGELQEFLEDGYTRFKQVPDIDHFLSEIDGRMTDIFEVIYTKPHSAKDAG